MFESLDELSPTGRCCRSTSIATRPRSDRQGDRQGPAEDDLKDGDLDRPVLLRRADLRGRRPRRELIDRHFTGPRHGSAASGWRCSPPRRWAPLPRPIRAPTGTLLPVGGVLQWRRDGSCTSGTPTRSRTSSTPSAPTWTPRRRRLSLARDPQEAYEKFAAQANQDAHAKAALRGLMKLARARAARAAGRGGAARARSSSASAPAR